jgi:transcriptional regulator with XRE-family HTH domain
MRHRLNENTLRKIGSNIRTIRMKKEKTQEEIAADAGIQSSYYSRIERGEANPSLEIIYTIVKALRVESSEVLPF